MLAHRLHCLNTEQNNWTIYFITDFCVPEITYSRTHNERTSSLKCVCLCQVGKGPFTNTCKGAWWEKKKPTIIAKFLLALASDLKKKKKKKKKTFMALLFAMMGEPHTKVCKLNFHLKMCGIFFSRPPLQWSKLLGAPSFYQVLLTNVFGWFLTLTQCTFSPLYFSTTAHDTKHSTRASHTQAVFFI